MLILKFPISSFGLSSQLNLSPKTHSLTLLMFPKFSYALYLMEFGANHLIDICQGYCFGLIVHSFAQGFSLMIL